VLVLTMELCFSITFHVAHCYRVVIPARAPSTCYNRGIYFFFLWPQNKVHIDLKKKDELILI